MEPSGAEAGRTKQQLQTLLRILDGQLQDQTWIVGSSLSIADAAAFFNLLPLWLTVCCTCHMTWSLCAGMPCTDII